jgi:CDGSH-type Zn-finger protein
VTEGIGAVWAITSHVQAAHSKVCGAGLQTGIEEAESTMTDRACSTQLGSVRADLEEGKGARWCCCGRSATQPFCDGSHAGTGIEPLVFAAKRAESINLYGCKTCDDCPYRDGADNVL